MQPCINKHPIFLHANELADICAPLNKLRIHYFAHANIDKDNQFSGLSNHPHFSAHYFQHQYYHADIHAAPIDPTTHYFIWDLVKLHGKSAKMQQAAADHQLLHTFSIIQGSDYYHFATHVTDTAFNHTYIRHLDLLKTFLLHFHDHVNPAKHLAAAYDFKFKTQLKQTLDWNIEADRQAFLEAIHINKQFHIKGDTTLTVREMEILYWLHQGKTITDIATILAIKEVTINKHIAYIKQKTKCYTQFQLGELFSSLWQDAHTLIKKMY